MIAKIPRKSSNPNKLPREGRTAEAEESSPPIEETKGGGFPSYALAGLLIVALGEILLFSGNYWIGIYFTPIQWTGYILFMDGLHKRLKGTSVISDHFGEFALLLLISIGSWLIFEGYNLLLENWRYVGLPENRLLRYSGYAWSFATISPAIFLTYQVLDDLLPGPSPFAGPSRMGSSAFAILVFLGLACLVVPVVKPSTYMTPLVWLGFALFLDPINHRLGERSILAELFSGHGRSLGILFLSGLVCGLFWEFWNYWSTAKWHYDVPYWGHIKLFEMPVLGFLGFMPFTIECFAIYKFVRRILPIPLKERYLG
ncbi:MAG: hypothetical protein GTO51_02480 [Candidatus Latescibacteria bacterium]|nr:hypothetical protein [Candidatus Latescibacterota bacterium]NIM22527.1 hypothetical protein [Candidatus Latescibacterota bacterium]NIM64841.1 hypothetical protein [Candidatus Latescibacterota bacterium]NIO01349.1 hypothetical protein [Candidatus Latescibacterota bacterium]NIO27838.1 hypothetical protein [Candidatus Latescibacterota bacterium]